jgi:hypothetical protein
MFVVDLANSGDLESLAHEQGAEFFGPHRQSPPAAAFDVGVEGAP